MIEIIIDGDHNKGKVLLASMIKTFLTSFPVNVEWPLEGFETERDRLDYATKSFDRRELDGVDVTIKTIKR